ncbi:uncharacterized protein LOC128682667 [Plodia interpunctella]|uniref:uncharacterized protein LOC128682667 n=1 Tax=Plodia interpunctella TaxID=58824 RepID=UPI0023674812|nr:uncharacterized protein LOC128682667 [Plodia interpunctella]
MLLPDNAHIQAFADDVLLIVEGKSREEVERTTNTCLREIYSWGDRVKLRFAPEKTQCISFTTQTLTAEIEMNNVRIPLTTQIKLLGVIIDNKLNFIQHSKYIIGKATKIFKNLCKFVRPTWGIHPENVECIYRQVITPIITYAAGIWGTATRFCSVRRALRSFQRAFAIRAIRGFHTISAVAADALARFPPLHLVVEEARETHLIKQSGTLGSLPEDIGLYRRVGIRDLLHPAKRVTIDYDTATTQEETDYLMNPEAPNVFTDGSKHENGDTGSAFVVIMEGLPGGSVTRKFKLCRTSTVFMAELYAIAQALEWLRARNHSLAKIFTDSLSALKAIQDRSNTDHLVNRIHRDLFLLRSRNQMVDFVWTKAHVGIVGNEIADAAAKAAASKKTASEVNFFPLSHAKRLLKAKTLQAWQAEYQSTTQGATTKTFFPLICHIPSALSAFKISFSLTQILTGHGFHKAYLSKFKIIDDDKCPCDGTTAQDIPHLLRECPIFGKTRHDYVTACLRNKIDEFDLIQTSSKEETTTTFLKLVDNIVYSLKTINGT